MSRTQIGEHAVVLGAGMAGLLSARVLAEHYARVTVVDRDTMPEIGVNRRGVPQDRHLHGLHQRGREILEERFPGVTARLVAEGALAGDVLGNLRWQVSGHQFRQCDIGLMSLFGTRPFLEGHLRARVAALPGVRFAERTDVLALTTTTGGRARVSGVRVQPNDDGSGVVELGADLVVDATGRGSRAPRWPDALVTPAPTRNRFVLTSVTPPGTTGCPRACWAPTWRWSPPRRPSARGGRCSPRWRAGGTR